ncbi:hypothetical protein HJC03_23275 [Rhizobium sp. NLR4b]|uniref:hypothetical protein n=1 Tax=unclassified Rhizobium TaxID=2613769 RepID=UPI001C83EA3E|nr:MULTISPECIES: hypothetical protein [unclassified Rhizobium]MBX5253293.1 hypothetical protein [Rhizobium sp. NLR4b]MBX5268523.1 hypothetical protein [Rhizobium sp. NLR17b]
MSYISGPTLPEGDPDRFIKCQYELQFVFSEMVDAAVAAGWKPEEVLTAIIELADNHALMLAENAELDRIIAALKSGP